MGGVEINRNAEVIDLEGAVIPGLFAAGEVTGGVHGACRLGSVAIIDCLVFGRIAGRNVASGAATHAIAA
jgi:urocanate reductase